MGALIYLERPQRFEEELRKIAGSRVRDVMTKEVITVHEDAPIHEIANLMIDKGINRVPVMRASASGGYNHPSRYCKVFLAQSERIVPYFLIQVSI